MAPDRQILIVGRPGDWTINVGEAAAARLVPTHTFGGTYSDELAIFDSITS